LQTGANVEYAGDMKQAATGFEPANPKSEAMLEAEEASMACLDSQIEAHPVSTIQHDVPLDEELLRVAMDQALSGIAWVALVEEVAASSKASSGPMSPADDDAACWFKARL